MCLTSFRALQPFLFMSLLCGEKMQRGLFDLSRLLAINITPWLLFKAVRQAPAGYSTPKENNEIKKRGIRRSRQVSRQAGRLAAREPRRAAPFAEPSSSEHRPAGMGLTCTSKTVKYTHVRANYSPPFSRWPLSATE